MTHIKNGASAAKHDITEGIKEFSSNTAEGVKDFTSEVKKIFNSKENQYNNSITNNIKNTSMPNQHQQPTATHSDNNFSLNKNENSITSQTNNNSMQ